MASGLKQRKKLTLYVDVGLSGQLVICNSEWMVCAACLAGGVFEGRDLKNGMIAVSGAIQDVEINAELEASVKTICDTEPLGICGAGIISAAASMLTAGIIGQNGKFNKDIRSPRIRKGAEGYEYVLVKASDSASGEDIVVTETDLDKLMRAKAAIYAGCGILGKSVNVTPADLELVVVAGNLGSSLDIEKAITIGLLPDIDRNKFVFTGNASMAGTRLVTFSTELLDDARQVAQAMIDMQLDNDADYIATYKSSLAFPHTEAGVFPSITAKLKRAK